MQETASNLLGKYFNKKSQHQGQQQSRRQEAGQKNLHPLLLNFLTDPLLKNLIESGLDAKAEYSISHVSVPKDVLLTLLKEFDKVKNVDKTVAEYEKRINEQNKIIENLSSQSHQVKNDLSLLEKKEGHERETLNATIAELNHLLEERSHQIQNYKSQICEKDLQVNQLKETINKLNSQIRTYENEETILTSRIEALLLERNKLKNILSASFSNTDKTKIQLSQAMQDDSSPLKKLDLESIFSHKLGLRVCSFLDYKDLLNLRVSNKSLNFIFNNNSIYYFTMAQQIRKKWLGIRNDLLKKLNVHKELAKQIPESFVKHTFSKYIWNKETIGEYMIHSIVQAEKLFNALLDFEKNQKNQTGPAESKSFFQKFAKKIDDVKTFSVKPSPTSNAISQDLLDTTVYEQKQPSVEQKIVPNLLELNFPTFDTPGQDNPSYRAPDSDFPDKLFDLPEVKRHLFMSNFANNPFCVFIPTDAFRNPKDEKKQFLQKAAANVEDVTRAVNKRKSFILENQDFLNLMIQSYAQMLVNSKVLLQESKELEALKDYLISKYDEIKNKLLATENTIEDHKEALMTERNMKDIFSRKATELETQLHNQNAHILKDSENLLRSQAQIKNLEEEVQKLGKERQEHENKVKVLVKEVKSLRNKNKELESTNQHVLKGYHDLKLTFDNLDIDDV